MAEGRAAGLTSGFGQALFERALGERDRDAVLGVFAAHPSVVHRASLDALRSAVDCVRGDSDLLPTGFAWRAGYGLHLHGSFEEATRVYAAADPGEGDDVDRARLRGVEAATAWARGDGASSRRLADAALALATDCDDHLAMGHAWVAQALVFALEGDRDANRHAYRRALDFAERAGDKHLATRVHNNLGSMANEESRHREALEHLSAALGLATELDDPPIVALAEFNLAEAKAGLSLFEEARTSFESARRVWQDVDSPLRAIAALGQGDIHRIRGAASQAAASYREAIEVGERHDNQQAVVPAMAGLARVGILDDPQRSESLLEDALARPAALGHVRVNLAAGWVALCRGDADRAIEFARIAEEEAGRRRDARGLAEALELRALCDDDRSARGRLDEAATIWRRIESPLQQARNAVIQARVDGDRRREDEGRAQLRALGVSEAFFRIAGPLMAIGDVESPPVRIDLLGGFTVRVDGLAVPGSQWQSRKARELVKALATRAGRPIARDELGDLLWPDAGAETRGRLSVLLSNIRKIFDPERAYPPDHFIDADRDAVRLDLTHVTIDTDLFERRSQLALTRSAESTPDARGLLEEAAAAYGGDFLEEDPYLDWAAPTRDLLRGLHIQVRWELARLLIDSADEGLAVPWLVGILADEPYDERAHTTLVGILAAAGRHGEARRFFDAYRARMAELQAPAASFADLVDGDRDDV